MLFNLCLHFSGQARKLRSQQSSDTERLLHAANTGFPVIDVFLQAVQRRGDLLIQSCLCLLHPMTMTLQNRCYKIGLGGKVMVNAGFTDLDRLGDIGIAECRETAIHQQLVCDVDDLLCCFPTHTLIRLPTSRDGYIFISSFSKPRRNVEMYEELSAGHPASLEDDETAIMLPSLPARIRFEFEGGML